MIEEVLKIALGYGGAGVCAVIFYLREQKANARADRAEELLRAEKDARIADAAEWTAVAKGMATQQTDVVRLFENIDRRLPPRR